MAKDGALNAEQVGVTMPEAAERPDIDDHLARIAAAAGAHHCVTAGHEDPRWFCGRLAGGSPGKGIRTLSAEQPSDLGRGPTRGMREVTAAKQRGRGGKNATTIPALAYH
jgi:hypothetical protein